MIGNRFSIAIDRDMSVGAIIALAIVILLLPSSMSALGGYRDLVLIVNSALLLAGLFVLLLLPNLIPLFEQWRHLRWIASLASDTRRVILSQQGPIVLGLACLINVLTIMLIWCVGRAQGLMLPVSDAAVLFVVWLLYSGSPARRAIESSRQFIGSSHSGYHSSRHGRALEQA